ncbi:Lrp/AsnC family transcriptional regulator [Azotosporobacter soli]|uniref:Lrp/AsnC family transcriptional regulator n=1 Tax=Azotosporobacter soli TaxID=3055040 RepID=UPI0031FF2DEC
MKFDDIDFNILAELQKNSRVSIRELSKKINLSPPSVTERVRRLEDNGVIEGYTIKINKNKLGLTIKCIVEVTLKGSEYELAPSYIINYPKCEYCFRVAGESCFIVVLSLSSFSEAEDFIKEISPFAMTKTKFVFEQLNINEDIKKYFPK